MKKIVTEIKIKDCFYKHSKYETNLDEHFKSIKTKVSSRDKKDNLLDLKYYGDKYGRHDHIQVIWGSNPYGTCNLSVVTKEYNILGNLWTLRFLDQEYGTNSKLYKKACTFLEKRTGWTRAALEDRDWEEQHPSYDEDDYKEYYEEEIEEE